MRSRLVTFLGLLSLVALLSGLVGPQADARPGHRAGSRISLRTAAAEVADGTAVTLTGTGRGQTTGAIKLVESSGSSWVQVASMRSATRTFSFSLTPTTGSHTYRATQRTAQGGLVTSSSVTVTVAAPVTVSPELAAARARILADTNSYRAAAGLAPLTESTAADAVAQAWSEHMASTADFEHNPDYASQMPAHWSRVGENIAYGFSPDSVGAGWFASPGHRANMLGDFTVIGIGYALDSAGRGYYTQDFGKY